MKRLLLVIVALFLFSCSNDDTPFTEGGDLIGTWLLIEQLVDPGDGSGIFRRIDSDKTITFSTDATYSATGSFCSMNTQAGGIIGGTYEINDENITSFSRDNFLIKKNSPMLCVGVSDEMSFPQMRESK